MLAGFEWVLGTLKTSLTKCKWFKLVIFFSRVRLGTGVRQSEFTDCPNLAVVEIQISFVADSAC